MDKFRREVRNVHKSNGRTMHCGFISNQLPTYYKSCMKTDPFGYGSRVCRSADAS